MCLFRASSNFPSVSSLSNWCASPFTFGYPTLSRRQVLLQNPTLFLGEIQCFLRSQRFPRHRRLPLNPLWLGRNNRGDLRWAGSFINFPEKFNIMFNDFSFAQISDYTGKSALTCAVMLFLAVPSVSQHFSIKKTLMLCMTTSFKNCFSYTHMFIFVKRA